MKMLNEQNKQIKGYFLFYYKKYEIVCSLINKPFMVHIYLDGETLGDPFSDNFCKNIPDAIEWIDEDIRCRKEAEENEVF